jgi:hypothetical protein
VEAAALEMGAAVGDGEGAADAVGAGASEGVGLEVGLAVGLEVGFGVSLGVGLAVGFEVGFGVRLGVGCGVPGASTTILPAICSGWTSQKYGYVPGVVNVHSKVGRGSSIPMIPESNFPSGRGGVPDVTLWGSPANVQRTVSPTPTVSEGGPKR